MSTSTATAYKYSVAGHLSFGAPKCEKAQKSSGFWANRTYWLCIKDNVLIDPCMGSGHILVYAFDVLMQIYESAGYGQRDAARSILENNLYGIDIDDRAFQMAYFAVMMKARQYNRRILNGECEPNLYSIQESNGINRNQLEYFGVGLTESEKKTAVAQMTRLLETFKDAKEYGSIITVEQYDWKLLDRFTVGIEDIGQVSMYTVGLDKTKTELQHMIEQGKILAAKYHVAITNPPYMGAGGMSVALSEYLKGNYNDIKSDLFAIFIVKCLGLVKNNYYASLITPQAFMFLLSFTELRKIVLQKSYIDSMLHLGFGTFGADFGTTAYVLCKTKCDSKGTFFRLTQARSSEEKRDLLQTLIHNSDFFTMKMHKFNSLPNSILAYWVSNRFLSIFENEKRLGDISSITRGLTTGNNEKYLRVWYEVPFDQIGLNCKSLEEAKTSNFKWFPHNKGGDYRTWYGNNELVVEFKNGGESLRHYYETNKAVRFTGIEHYFHEGITWTALSSGTNSFRYSTMHIFDSNKGPMLFADEKDLYYILGLLCSKVCTYIIRILNPTVSLQNADMNNIPYVINDNSYEKVVALSKENVAASKADWDSFEISWEFIRHPLINGGRTLNESFILWEQETKERFNLVKKNEEEINSYFVEAYGLENELDPAVDDKTISIRVADLKRDIRSLLSYIVGCMFGRYSLETDGVCNRKGDMNRKDYQRFIPDDDNVIPITDEEYLEDDIVTRICAWLKAVYGGETLEENLDFIAKALGNKGESSRDIIRNYFLNDFFKDHCQTYSVTGSGKRPIYWLFDSGKQNGFKALIYLHRYNADTIGNLRIDYLHRMQRIYESEISRMQDMIDHSTNAREVAQATKRREKLTKQLKECREYDEKLAHLALSRIELDLDDGVKVNYRKIQTANDGKFYEVLADSKNIMAKK